MKHALIFCLSLAIASTSNAYLSVAESAEVLPPGKYQVGVAPQVLLSSGGGTNFDVYLDDALNESTTGRISIGAGTIDFNAFASAKWIPFPDVDRQPAMGLRVGAGLGRSSGNNFLQLQGAPIFSKKFDTEYGLAVPYLAVPITFLNKKDENTVASNLAIGSELHHKDYEQMTLGAELGLNLNNSYSYITVFAAFPFESHKGFRK